MSSNEVNDSRVFTRQGLSTAVKIMKNVTHSHLYYKKIKVYLYFQLY